MLYRKNYTERIKAQQSTPKYSAALRKHRAIVQSMGATEQRRSTTRRGMDTTTTTSQCTKIVHLFPLHSAAAAVVVASASLKA